MSLALSEICISDDELKEMADDPRFDEQMKQTISAFGIPELFSTHNITESFNLLQILQASLLPWNYQLAQYLSDNTSMI